MMVQEGDPPMMVQEGDRMFGAPTRKAIREGGKRMFPRRGRLALLRACCARPRPRNSVTSGGADLRVDTQNWRAPTHTRARRVRRGPACGGEGQALRGQGAGARATPADDQKRALLRCSAGGASGGTAGGRRDPGGRCRSWASWAKGSNQAGAVRWALPCDDHGRGPRSPCRTPSAVPERTPPR